MENATATQEQQYFERTSFLLFGAIAIDKCKCHYPKNPIYTDEVDIGKILISNKVSFGKTGYKYFTGYKNNDKVN